MKEIYKKYLKNYNECEIHLNRLEFSIKKIQSKYNFPLIKENIIEILNKDEWIAFLDQIAYRFSKFQDKLITVLRLYLTLKGENIDNLTAIDVINLAEKFNINISNEEWLNLRELRNILTHEYEDNPEKIKEAINTIVEKLPYLKNLLFQLKLEISY